MESNPDTSREAKLLNMYKPTPSEGAKFVLLVDNETVTVLDYLRDPTCIVVRNEYDLISNLLHQVCGKMSYETIEIVADGETTKLTSKDEEGGDENGY